MALPDIWHFSEITGVLIGPGKADPSPLDQEGVWLIPAYATDIEPPATIKEGQQVVFDLYDETWSVEDIPEPEPEAPILTPVEE